MSEFEKVIKRIRMDNYYSFQCLKRIKILSDELAKIRMELKALNLEDAVQLVDKIDDIIIAKKKIKEYLKSRIPEDMINQIILDFFEKGEEE
jgi:hypothetical protein